MISAEQAREMSCMITDSEHKRMDRLEDSIKMAISFGRNYIVTDDVLTSRIRKELENLGYKLEYSYSPKNESGYKISW